MVLALSLEHERPNLLGERRGADRRLTIGEVCGRQVVVNSRGAKSSSQSAPDRLDEAISGRIRTGELAVGSRLPGERSIAREFGTSRSTVRQAVRALESRGTVQVRERSGTYVRAPTPERVSNALMQLISWTPRAVTIRDLLEVRMAFEIETAGLAAERRTQEDLRKIAQALADTASNAALADADPSEESLAVWAAADVEFHGSLARATGNPLLAIIYDSLRSAFVEQRMHTGTALPETRAKSFQYHQRIFDQVCARDGAGAREAMREHLLEARDTMLRYAVQMESSPRVQAAPVELERPGPT